MLAAAVLAAPGLWRQPSQASRRGRRLPRRPSPSSRSARNRAGLQRVGCDAGRLRQRADPAAGQRLSDQDDYREGTLVRKGQVLFEIDARPFEAVARADTAQLAQAQADLGRTERDVARDTPLAKERAIPQSQLDNDIQANLAAQAAVKSARGQPRDGAAESRLHQGALADRRRRRDRHRADWRSRQTESLLTTVSQVDPIRAYFSLSEQEYLGGRRSDQSAGSAQDAVEERQRACS